MAFSRGGVESALPGGAVFLWACLVEVLGFGCMSGPLVCGTTRTWLDVRLYAAFVASLVRALVAPEIGVAQLVPIVPTSGSAASATRRSCSPRVEYHFGVASSGGGCSPRIPTISLPHGSAG